MVRKTGLLMICGLVVVSMVACQSKTAGNGENPLKAESVIKVEPSVTPEKKAPGKTPDAPEKTVPKKITEAPETPVAEAGPTITEAGFASNAFPPTMPDTDWHRTGWVKNDCLRCHETGVQDAPVIEHKSMPDILLTAKCRSCHVLIPGQKPRGVAKKEEVEGMFASNAFPPMIPNSGSHAGSWTVDDCMLCHETGVRDAPIVVHKDLPPILLKAKCRSCHVQVRSLDSNWTK